MKITKKINSICKTEEELAAAKLAEEEKEMKRKKTRYLTEEEALAKYR